MKTAISIPDEVFVEAERYARKVGKTRSQLYSEAMRQYLLRHAPEAVTEGFNTVCANLDQTEGDWVQAASRRILQREKW